MSVSGLTRSTWMGMLAGVGAVSIWALWMPVTRLSVSQGLTPVDIAFLRFVLAGALLLPVAIKRGLVLDRVRPWQVLIIVLGAGAPYSMLAATGLKYAPAADAGALIPGTMPLFAGLLAAAFVGERLTRKAGLGYVFIIVGALGIAGTGWLSGFKPETMGHALFLTAAFFWAAYTVTLRRSGLDALHSAALVAVGSAVVITPIFLSQTSSGFSLVSLEHLALQMIFQGVIATILSLFLFGHAVAVLGAARAAAFGALVPVLATLFSIPILSELPSPTETLGIALVSLGVVLVFACRPTPSPGSMPILRSK